MDIPAGFSQVNLKFTGLAVPLGAQCVFGVENTTALTPTQIATVVDTHYNTHIKAQMQADAALTAVLVKNGPVSTGPFAELSVSRVGPGVGATASPNVAHLIRKVTGSGGRRNRGRMFLPAVAEANVSAGGVLVAGTVTAMNTAFAGFLAAMAGSDLDLYLLHAGAGAPPPTAITGLICDGRVATQRRRLR